MRNAKARDGQVVVLQEYEDYSQKREPCYLRPWVPRYLLTKAAALVDQVACRVVGKAHTLHGIVRAA